jgi:glycosyltransferase involved in cell wall biosynthesis
MTIVHLVIGGRVAGGQVVALRLARAARARGHRCAFVSPDEGPFTELVRADGFDVRLVDVTRTFRLDGLVRLTRLLRREHADVLHTHTQLAPNILGRIAGRLAGARVISHLHIENYFRPQPVARLVHRTLDNLTARLAHRVVAVSEDTRRALVAQGYPARLVEVVHNGIEIPEPGDGGVDEDVVVEVARLAEVKGQRTLIRALEHVPQARVVLVGEDLERGGAYRDELADEAEQLGVADRVVFAGYREDATELMSRAAIVALPSTTEGLPVVLLEAMARARPVMATPVGGVPELVADGETGLIVPPDDPKALADALLRLLGDRGFAQRLGDAGRERVRSAFSADAQESRILELYEEVA